MLLSAASGISSQPRWHNSKRRTRRCLSLILSDSPAAVNSSRIGRHQDPGRLPPLEEVRQVLDPLRRGAAGYNHPEASPAIPDSNVPEPKSLRSSQPPPCPRATFIEALRETIANRRQSARSPAAAAEGRRDVGTEYGV